MPQRKNVFVFANQKGGVTKSTSSANLAAALSMKGKRVLFIDTDPQGNGSSILGFQPYENNNFLSTYDIITTNNTIKSEKDFILSTTFTNLFFVPSSPDLYNADAELAGKYTAVYSLRKALHLFDLRDKFDYVIFDTPPNLGIMTYSALTASDKIVIPVIPDKYAIEGMAQLQRAIVDVKENLNPDLELFGVLLSRIRKNENMSKRIIKRANEYFGRKTLFNTVIRKNVTAEEANAVNRPVVFYDERSNSAKDYMKLADEVLDRDQTR